LLRLRRVVGSYSVGRIVNPRTARAQLIGGITCRSQRKSSSLSGERARPAPRFRGGKNLLSAIL
jgi:hypothetical protein